MVNGILKQAQSQGTLHNVLLYNTPGVTLTSDGIKVHFKNVNGSPRIYVVVNVQIVLSDTDSWWWEKLIGNGAEGWNGGTGVITLPIELQFEPKLKTVEYNSYYLKLSKNVVALSLITGPLMQKTKADGSGTYTGIRNTWGYPYIYAKSASVESSIMESIGEMTADMKKDIEIDLDSLYNGMPLGGYPDSFAVEDGHLIIYGLFGKPIKIEETK